MQPDTANHPKDVLILQCIYMPLHLKSTVILPELPGGGGAGMLQVKTTSSSANQVPMQLCTYSNALFPGMIDRLSDGRRQLDEVLIRDELT